MFTLKIDGVEKDYIAVDLTKGLTQPDQLKVSLARYEANQLGKTFSLYKDTVCLFKGSIEKVNFKLSSDSETVHVGVRNDSRHLFRKLTGVQSWSTDKIKTIVQTLMSGVGLTEGAINDPWNVWHRDVQDTCDVWSANEILGLACSNDTVALGAGNIFGSMLWTLSPPQNQSWETWRASYDVKGGTLKFDVIKFVTENIVDSYQVQTTVFYLYGADNWGAGQAFTSPAQTKYLCKVKFYLRREGNPPAGAIRALLYNATGTVGVDAVPTGDPLYQSAAVNINTLTSSFQWIEFDFRYPIKLSLNTDYCIVVKYTGGDGSNCLAAGAGGDGSGHAGNTVRYSGGSWNAINANDFCFIILEDKQIINEDVVLPFDLSSITETSLGFGVRFTRPTTGDASPELYSWDVTHFSDYYEFTVDEEYKFDALDRLARSLNGKWWVDPDGKLHFRQTRGSDKTVSVIFKVGDNCEAVDYAEDTLSKFKRVTVIGEDAAGNEIKVSEQTADYNGAADFEAVHRDGDLKTESACRTAARNLLDLHATNLVNCTVEVSAEYADDVDVGDKVRFVYPARNVDVGLYVKNLYLTVSGEGEKLSIELASQLYEPPDEMLEIKNLKRWV